MMFVQYVTCQTRRLSVPALLVLLCVAAVPAGPVRADEAAVNRFPVQQGGKYGFIDRTGKIVIDLTYSSAYDFTDGLAAVMVGGEPNTWGIVEGGKWGYIDTMGKMVIPASFDSTDGFSDGLAAVAVRDSWGFIDPTGRMKIRPQFRFQGMLQHPRFVDGRAPVAHDGRLDIIDENGTVLHSLDSLDAWEFSEGMAAARSARANAPRLWGYVDTSGALVIPCQFNAASRFMAGVAPVWDTSNDLGLTRYIDHSGRQVFRDTFFGAGEFSEGLASVGKGSKRGFIDRKGKLVIPAKFFNLLNFSESLAAVRTQEGMKAPWGFIDRTGKLVIPCQFELARSFSGGLAKVWLGEDEGYIDRAGKFVWRAKR